MALTRSIPIGVVVSCFLDNQLAIRVEIIEKDGRSYAKPTVGSGIVPHVVGVEKVWGFSIVGGDAAGDGHTCRAISGGVDGDDKAAVGAARAAAW